MLTSLLLVLFYVLFFVFSIITMTPFLLRWLETVSSTFQQLYFDGSILHVPLFLSSDATMLVSHTHPLIGCQVLVLVNE